MAYQGALFTLLTQHGKEAVIGPLLAAAFGARLQLVTGFDTDTLGTFAGDVRRVGSQLDAAREKARVGRALSGCSLTLGSEGTFGPGLLGLGSVNVEVIVLVDARSGLEIVGRAGAPGTHASAQVSTGAALEAAAAGLGFPAHGLVIRPDALDAPASHKGVRTVAQLSEAFVEAQARSRTGVVVLETDLRAHMNPSRMKTIAAATEDLIDRMRCLCAHCGAPGFGRLDRVPGLPCADCGEPTEQPRAERFACVACVHQEVRPLPVVSASAACCQWCNP